MIAEPILAAIGPSFRPRSDCNDWAVQRSTKPVSGQSQTVRGSDRDLRFSNHTEHASAALALGEARPAVRRRPQTSLSV